MNMDHKMFEEKFCGAYCHMGREAHCKEKWVFWDVDCVIDWRIMFYNLNYL